MFGRATIRLGIGPHFSFFFFFLLLFSAVGDERDLRRFFVARNGRGNEGGGTKGGRMREERDLLSEKNEKSAPMLVYNEKYTLSQKVPTF